MLKYFYTTLIVCFICCIHITSAQTSQKYCSVQARLVGKWNNPEGFVYRQIPGFNLGVTSFAQMDDKRTAYLSDASDKVIILSQGSFTRFKIGFAARDFAYDNGLFYILFEREVKVYNEKGTLVKSIPIASGLMGVMHVARVNNITYLLLPNGNSYEMENGKIYRGWVTETGCFVQTDIRAKNLYKIVVTEANGNIIEKSFSSDKRLAGAYIVGCTSNRLFIDVQTFITESPISVERHLVCIELDRNGLGDIVYTQKIPDCYYVLSNKELSVDKNGKVLNMVTSPNGVYLCTLQEAGKETGYPDEIAKVKYHFNDHLVKERNNKN